MKKGFTLIELMIVMVILGVLASIGVQAFISSQTKGRDSARKADLKAIAGALELYYNDKGVYPTAGSGANAGYMMACWSGAAVACDGTDTAHKTMSDGTTIYMAVVPKDPVSTQRYWYVSSNGKQYQLYAHLENDTEPNKDPQIIIPTASGTNCGPSCNYGVSSGNITP